MLAAACGDAAPVTPTGPIVEERVEPFLSWPMPGVGGADWVINNYVDLSRSSTVLDYRGGAKSYDGHRGVDIDVPNFRWMDADFAVQAAAAGTVISAHDSEFDRNVGCNGTWNSVTVRHEDGSQATYGHVKRGSIVVSVGASVTAGQRLASVGSSGCSTQPHLHFELLSTGGTVIDPFEAGLWIDPPPYDTPLTFMDASFQVGAITGVDRLKDPLPDITAISVGSTLGVGVSMAGGGPGDQVALTLRDGDGSAVFTGGVTFDRIWRHTYWYWNADIAGVPGVWTATISVNGNPVATHDLTVG